MGKRTLVLLVCLLLTACFAVPASAKVSVELTGGLVMPNPAAFNKDFTSAYANTYGNPALSLAGYNTVPSDVKGTNISQLFNGGANIKFFFNDSFALLLRGDYLNTDYEDDISIEGVNCLYNHLSINGGFFGLGLAYYANLSPAFSFFVSGDGGMFMQFSSFYELGADSDPAAQNELTTVNLPCAYNNNFPPGSHDPFGSAGPDLSGNTNFNSSGFGGHIELGLQFMFTDALGITLHGGYQVLSIPITYPNAVPFNAVDASGNKLFKATSINLSGPYFGGGVVVAFGSTPAAGGKAASSGGISKYEQYGDYYYKQKNYAYAVKYYAGAIKTAPNAGLYKKIGFSYYYLKDTAKAMYYLKEYVKQNPDDAQMRKWLGI